MSDLRLETTDVPHIGGTSFYGFAVQVHSALIEQGLVVDPRDPLVDPADGAVVARVDDLQVGTITYRYFAVNKTLYACAAFVLPDWRRRGVFSNMFHELLRVASERGASKVEAGTLTTNEAFKRAAVSAGMSLAHHKYVINVPDGKEA